MKKFFAIIVIAAFALTLVAQTGRAEETNKFVEFWRKLFGYPAGVVRESVKTTANTAKTSINRFSQKKCITRCGHLRQ